MFESNKVVWYNGMFPDVQVFQQNDLYFQELVNFRSRSILRNCWGFLSYKLDDQAISGGTVKMLECSGFTPDGLAFQMPHEHPLPDTIQIDESVFPATEHALSVVLALPAEDAQGQNTLLPGDPENRPTRFSYSDVAKRDYNTGKSECEIRIARANFQLRFGEQGTDDFTFVKCAQVNRTTAGGYEYGKDFIAPSLCLSAAPRLGDIVRELLGRLVNQRALKWTERRLPTGRAEFTAADAYVLGYLNVLNQYIPLLKNEHSVGTEHPENIYRLLISLAGQLITYSTDDRIEPRDFPVYNHADLSSTFNTIATIIEQVLPQEIPPRFEDVNMTMHGPVYVGSLEAKHLSANTRLFLVASRESNVSEAALKSGFQNNVKIASRQMLNNVAVGDLVGLNRGLMNKTPVGLQDSGNDYHFRLEQSPLVIWNDIVKRQNVAFLLPEELKNVKLRLIAQLPLEA